MSNKAITAIFVQDSKRFHRYQIDADEEGEVVGSIYLKKGHTIPKQLIIELKVKDKD